MNEKIENTNEVEQDERQLFALAGEQHHQDDQIQNNRREIDLAIWEVSGWKLCPFEEEIQDDQDGPGCEEDIPFIPTHHLCLVTRLEEVDQLAA